MKLPAVPVNDLTDSTLNFEALQLRSILDFGGSYFQGAGKTTVVDGNFSTTPPNGTLAVHYDTTAGKTYLSVRANGTWHVMAGPV